LILSQGEPPTFFGSWHDRMSTMPSLADSSPRGTTSIGGMVRKELICKGSGPDPAAEREGCCSGIAATIA